MIFSRNRGNAGRHGSEGKGRHARGRVPDHSASEDEFDAEVDEEPEAPARPDFGPYDLAEAPEDGQERLDLGALRIPAIAGVEIQLQAGPEGQIQQVMLVHEDSRLQLGVYAAPRSEGIWGELRDTLRTSMAQAGARQEDATGDYGPELKARLRDGSSTVDIRHVGIDGPRWFVHAVFIGAAAVDPTRAGPLLDVLRGLVVDRGTDARPVSEALPLRLPPQAAAQLAAQAQMESRPTGTTGAADAQKPAVAQPATTARASGRGGAARRGTAGRGAGRQT